MSQVAPVHDGKPVPSEVSVSTLLIQLATATSYVAVCWNASAAKNHPSVAIVTSPARYADVLAALAAGGFTLAERQRLAAEAFQHTATYDVAVASWMSSVLTDTSDGTGFPSWTGATWDKAAVLRYGENPHQPAALYRHWRGGLASAEQLHGKETVSYTHLTLPTNREV